MPFIPTVDTVRVDMLTDLDGQHCENTLWFLSTGGAPTVATMIDLGDALNTYWQDQIAVELSIDTLFRGCVVTDQSSESAPAVDRAVTPFSGGQDAPSLPNNVAFCITFGTAGRGRASRGRNYVLGIPSTQVSNNTISGTYADSLVTGYAGISSVASAHGFEWVVVSHFLDNAPRAAGLAQVIVSVRYSDLTVDSQRRRLPGRGN